MQEFDESSQLLFNTWLRQADQWIDMMHDSPIPSFRKESDQKMVDLIHRLGCKSLLELGFADGSVIDKLEKLGCSASGLEMIPAFVDYAKAHKKGDFQYVESSEQFQRWIVSQNSKYDVILINFGLFSDESLDQYLPDLKKLMQPRARLLIQTMHLWSQAQSGRAYKSGWQPANWMEGFKDGDIDMPFPWYFRTLKEWFELFQANNYQLLNIHEFGEEQPHSMVFELLN